MPNFEHILFPVDLSEQSRQAAPFVRAVAERFGADIALLHVIEIPPYWYGTLGAESFAAMVDLPSLIAARKSEFAGFLTNDFNGLRVERAIQEGDPSEVIVEYVRNRGIDLIMMPTHGAGPFRQLLLGSVTAKVLHDVDCAVWTAAHTEGPATHPSEVRSMLCALELGPEALPLLKRCAELAASYGALLRIVHAVPGADAPPGQYCDTEFNAFLMNLAREELAQLQSKAQTCFDVCIGRGDVAKVVRETALHHEADLVVMGRGLLPRTLGRFRTHAYSVIREAPCPVLSVLSL
jgi:nucleotide-binding universal stress UspA family protein